MTKEEPRCGTCGHAKAKHYHGLGLCEYERQGAYESIHFCDCRRFRRETLPRLKVGDRIRYVGDMYPLYKGRIGVVSFIAWKIVTIDFGGAAINVMRRWVELVEEHNGLTWDECVALWENLSNLQANFYVGWGKVPPEWDESLLKHKWSRDCIRRWENPYKDSGK